MTMADDNKMRKPIRRIISDDDDDDEEEVMSNADPSSENVSLDQGEEEPVSDGEVSASPGSILSSDDDDVPLKVLAAKKKSAKRTVKKRTLQEEHSDGTDSSVDEDDEPVVKKIRASKPSKPKKSLPAKKKSKKSQSEDEDMVENVSDAPKLTASKRAKKADSEDTPSRKKKAAEQEDAVEVFKWWENTSWDNSVKWKTLEHNGVYFPPEYVPHGVKMLYDGQPITLSPASEEVAGFFAQLIGTQYVENITFCKNFFSDFLDVLAENDPGCPIKSLDKCDFSPMTEYFEKQREAKKQMTKEEKEEIKMAKKVIDDAFSYAFVDGRKEKVGNFRIEPPGLFRGRGDHPKTGKLKRRVQPEEVTINLGADAKVPPPPEGHSWGGIVHDSTVAWLATWTENVNGNIKYVLFAASSSFKGMSDLKKFEKARELKKHILRIRRDYTEELKDTIMATRQRATALWLIDRLALRAGNEKGEDEADTVGCCSLRFEHVELTEERALVDDPYNKGQQREIIRKMVTFDFLGKDSIRYYNKVEVDPVVWKNIKIFKRPPKVEGDAVFDRLTTSSVNKHLNNLMAGLTAKVFRTHNASSLFQEELKKTPADGTVQDKILAYNRANRQVAILCNHQRTVSKAFGAQMEKLEEKILGMKYERYRVRKALLEVDPKIKKRRPEIVEPESDMDEETAVRKHSDYIEQEKQKLDKRYEKMCEKAKADGEPVPEKPEFEERDLTESLEKLEKKYDQLSSRILIAKTQRTDKDENKTTSLGTSKINYIDPRITSAWCKKYDVPIEKMFTKTLREKFVWAMDVDENWIF